MLLLVDGWSWAQVVFHWRQQETSLNNGNCSCRAKPPNEQVVIRWPETSSQTSTHKHSRLKTPTLNEYSNRTKKGKLTAWRILFSFRVCSICLSFTTWMENNSNQKMIIHRKTSGGATAVLCISMHHPAKKLCVHESRALGRPRQTFCLFRIFMA